MKSHFRAGFWLLVSCLFVFVDQGERQTPGYMSQTVSDWDRGRRLSHRCGLRDGYCCRSDMSECKICLDQCLAGQYTPKEPNTFCWGNAPLPDCTLDAANTNINCRLNVIASFYKTLTVYSGSGLVSISNSMFDFFSTDSRCIYDDCVLEFQSGTNNLNKFITTTLGEAKFDTSNPINPGAGWYRWRCGVKYSPVSYSMSVVITVADNCGAPQVMQSNTYSDISKLQYQDNDSGFYTKTEPVSSFMSSSVSSSPCKFVDCKIVDSAGSFCTTTESGTIFTLTQTGQNVQIKLDTNNPMAARYFCVQCKTNDLTPQIIYSRPFKAEVTQLDCNGFLTIRTMTDKTIERAMTTEPQWNPVIQQHIILQNDYPSKCVVNFELVDATTNNPLPQTDIKIDTSGGIIYMNQHNLINQKLKVKLSARNGYLKYTNDFTLKSICPGINLPPIQQVYTYPIPETYTAGAMTTVMTQPDYVQFTSCQPTSITLLDSATGTPYPLSADISFSADGILKVGTMVPKTHSLMIQMLYNSALKITTTFTIVIECKAVQMNKTVSDYLWYIPDQPTTTATQVLNRSEHSSTPSNNVSCPIHYFVYSATTGLKYSGPFLSMNQVTGLLTIDINIVNTELIRVLVTYKSSELITNDFRVTVICLPINPPFYAKPITKFYRLHEANTALVDTAVISSTEIQNMFRVETCRWCKSQFNFKLVHASNNTDYTGKAVQVHTDYSVQTSTAQYLVNNPFWLQLISTDPYCLQFFANQKVYMDIEVCGDENIVVTPPNPAFIFTNRWNIDPNYQLTNLTKVFSMDRETRCPIYKYELWNSTKEETAMKDKTIWAQFIKINSATGVVTVNHNNKPGVANVNSTYTLYLMAFSLGDKIGYTKLTFNFVYPPPNKAPVFTDQYGRPADLASDVYRLTVREQEQQDGYFDPIAVYDSPIIQDPEGNKVFVEAQLANQYPCGCVKIQIEEKGKRTRFKILVDQSKVTKLDQFENNVRIKTYDNTFPQSQQTNFFTFKMRLYYVPKPAPIKPVPLPPVKGYEHDWRYNNSGQNVSAFIHSISVYGLMEVRFNASMNTFFNWSMVNQSLLDIYMVPDKPEPDINITRWNLTWNMTHYEDNRMFIQLKFNDPSAISQHIDQDRIVWHLKNFSEAFYSDEANNFLHHDYWTLTSRVRRQLGGEWQTWMQAAESNVATIKAMFLFSYIMALLPTGMNFRYFMWYLRSLQLVVHLPMLHVVVPPNVSRYLEVVKPIVVYDYLPSDQITSAIFPIDFESQRMKQTGILDQMEDLGYATHNSLLILGSIWIYALIYLIKLVGYLVYRFYKRTKSEVTTLKEGGMVSFQDSDVQNEETVENSPDIKRIICCFTCICPRTHFTGKSWKDVFMDGIRNTGESVFWTMILQIIIEPYMEWAIAAKLNLSQPIYTYSGDRFSNFIGVVCTLIAFILVPSVLLNLYRVPIKKFRSQRYTAKYGVIFYDIRSRVWYHQYYILMLTIRRLAFLTIAFDLGHTPSVQMLLMSVCNLANHIYIGMKPMQTKYMNWLHFLEELVIAACCAHMVVFMMSDDDLVDIGWGWSMIIIMNLHFLIVSIYMMYLTKEFLRVLCRRHTAPWKVWAVRRFGFRIGGRLHDMFTIDTGKRNVKQMMELEINKGTNDVTIDLKKHQYEKNQQVEHMLNHLPHMIERNQHMVILDQKGDLVSNKVRDLMTPDFNPDEEIQNRLTKMGDREDYKSPDFFIGPMAQKKTISTLNTRQEQDYQFANYQDYVDATFSRMGKMDGEQSSQTTPASRIITSRQQPQEHWEVMSRNTQKRSMWE